MTVVAMIGSREFKNHNLIEDMVQMFKNEWEGEPVKIISGGARGVDQKVKDCAEQMGLDFEDEKYKPKDYNNKSAYGRRNVKIVDDANMVIAFWNGSSRGTKMVIDMCLSRKKHLEVIFDV